jgi:hypothetical protein
MEGDLMSCLTCLRVQLEREMLTIENPARDRAGDVSFKICMGCASAIAAAVAALNSKVESSAPAEEQ